MRRSWHKPLMPAAPSWRPTEAATERKYSPFRSPVQLNGRRNGHLLRYNNGRPTGVPDWGAARATLAVG